MCHVARQARALGDYLLVGVLNDGVCNHYRGGSHPILNLNERVLSVLACKCVPREGEERKRDVEVCVRACVCV